MTEVFKSPSNKTSASVSLRRYVTHAILSVLENFDLRHFPTHVLGIDALLNQRYLDKGLKLIYGIGCKGIAIRVKAEPRPGYEAEADSLMRMAVNELTVYPCNGTVNYSSPLVTTSVTHDSTTGAIDIPEFFFDVIYAFEVDGYCTGTASYNKEKRVYIGKDSIHSI